MAMRQKNLVMAGAGGRRIASGTAKPPCWLPIGALPLAKNLHGNGAISANYRSCSGRAAAGQKRPVMIQQALPGLPWPPPCLPGSVGPVRRRRTSAFRRGRPQRANGMSSFATAHAPLIEQVVPYDLNSPLFRTMPQAAPSDGGRSAKYASVPVSVSVAASSARPSHRVLPAAMPRCRAPMTSRGFCRPA
jgi:hypothetical protein